MKTPPKKPVGKAGKKSAKTPPATGKKPAAGNVALAEPATAPLAEPFFYSSSEEFLWLADAVKLEQGAADYAPVRASVDKARKLVIHLMRQEMAQDDLVNYKKPSKRDKAKLRKWMALQTVKTTGRVDNRLVRYEMSRAGKQADAEFFGKIAKAQNLKKQKRPPVIDYERVKYLARFLVDAWCNPPGQASYAMWFRLLKTDEYQSDDGASLFDRAKPFYFLPPLCFLNENMRARFCADYLGKDRNDADMGPHAITQWVTRLGLKPTSKPTITGINAGGFQDGKKLITLVVSNVK